MELPDALRSLLASSSDPDPEVDPEARAARVDGGRIVAKGGEQIAIDVPDDADVDAERIEAALNGQAGGFDVRGQAGGETTVTPVASGSDIHISDSAFDLSGWEYSAFLDDQITNLIENRVDYTTDTGKWILANDDLIPGILIRLKSLMLGKDGLEVQPADPDIEADQRLADHMDAIYTGSPSVETHVDPSKVLDRVLEQNLLNAVYVGRSTDLQHLDVDDLSYVKDGETGDEIYIQEQTSYTTFDLDDDSGEVDVSVEHTEDRRALEIGTEVLDVRMYRTPPLQAIADDVVNKMQLKRLQGRKAEIASIGGIIIKVNPPAWLVEEDYDQYLDAADSQFGDESGRLLELVMAQQIEAALETLEEYQTATVMSIPENWETETIELPEMDESMSSMIRDYNEAISRRLLLPLDLIELKEGPELSRNSMMQMFLDQISGWQGQVSELFDQFAQVQAEIHGLDGEVEHSLPAIAAEDEQEIIQLFNYAGLLGMSEAEGRELANTLEGVDLETDPTRGMPDAGGPETPEDREQEMDEFLDQTPESGESADIEGSTVGDDGREPRASADDSTIKRREVLASLGLDDDEGLDRDIEADGYPADPEVWPHRAARAAWRNVGQSMDTCMAHMVTEAGWDDRKAEAFCAGLRDSLHQQNPLSQFQTEAAEAELDLTPPPAAQDNAQQVLDWHEEHPDEIEGMTETGWRRARQLAEGGELSADVVKRMAQFNRHRQHSGVAEEHQGTPWRDAGHVAWLGWGGDAGVDWAIETSEELAASFAELAAAGSYSEGDEVDTPEGVGVVVEVRTEEFDGPDGDVIDATSDDPAYVVGVETGVAVYRESDLSSGEIDAGVDQPEEELDVDEGEDAEGSTASVEAIRGDGRFQIPESWEESETPNRLILLKAWAGMGGQFDCASGDCCKGTMMKNGLNPKAANRFCAAMKDRVLGGWEGWRKGAAAAPSVEADWDPDAHPRGPDGKFIDVFGTFGTESERETITELFNEWAAWPLSEDTTPLWDAAVEAGEGSWEDDRITANIPDSAGIGSFLKEPDFDKQSIVEKYNEWLSEVLREEHGDTITAHRILHGEAAETVRNGNRLQPRALASWTTDKSALREVVVATGADVDEDLSDSVVVTKQIPVESVFGIHSVNDNLRSRDQRELVASLPENENLADGDVVEATEVLENVN